MTDQPLARITINCEPLDVERTAEVEARVRAMLLTAQISDPEVNIFCTTARADVDVKAGPAGAHVEVSSEGADLEGRLLDAVDRALRELAEAEPARRAPEAPAPALAPKLLVPTSPLPTSGASATPNQPPVSVTADRGSTASFEVSARALLERWSTSSAAGGNVGASFGTRTVRGALTLGALTQTDTDPAFRSRELQSALAVIGEPSWTWGVRGSAAVGASFLAVTPSEEYTPRAGTTATAAFVELAISRPFWLTSRWGLAPRLAARLFTARRNVTVDVADALVLAGIAPSFGLELSYRVE